MSRKHGKGGAIQLDAPSTADSGASNQETSTTPAGPARRRPREEAWLTRASWLGQAGYLAVLLVAAVLLQWFMEGPGATSVAVLSGGWLAVGVVVAAGSWFARDELYRYLASARSGVVVLAAILVGTGLGTVILQDLGPSAFQQRYPSMGALLQALHLDDVFHSYPFVLLMVLVIVTSVATVMRRRRTMLRWRNFGLLLSHTSIIAILAGAMVGSMSGRKGMVHLEIGESASSYIVEKSRSAVAGDRAQMPFEVRLDGFELEHYEPEFKLYTYKKKGDGYEVVGADAPVAGEAAGAPGPGSEMAITVKRVFERAERIDTWVPAPASAAQGDISQAARVTLRVGQDPGGEGWLARPGSNDSWLTLDEGRSEVRFVWTAPSADQLAKLARQSAEAPLQIEANGVRIPVEIGKTVTLADGRAVAVEALLADFALDSTTHEAFSRSNSPNNPALAVRVLTEARPPTPPRRSTSSRVPTCAR